MSTAKPLATLSLDLDDKWSYLKTRGHPSWVSLPSYLSTLIPRVLDFLKHRNLTITVFIVGLDAEQERNRDLLQSIAQSGHEIGNHSFHHEPWLHLYTREQLQTELDSAEQAITRATGVHPVGFRGPGFSYSADLIDLLVRRFYLYDASTLPTYLGPLARAYYFKHARLSEQQSDERKSLFGNFKDGARPNCAYWWQTGTGKLLEIPVTTMPYLRVPIHASYLVYLSSFASSLALRYFKIALSLCRLGGTEPSLLLHPLDFLGCDDTSDLEFFPAMRMHSRQKCSFLARVLDLYMEEFTVIPLQEYARQFEQRKNVLAYKSSSRDATL